MTDIASSIADQFAPAYRIPELLGSRDWLHRFAAACGKKDEAEHLVSRLSPSLSFNHEQVKEMWKRRLQESPDADLHFYIHIPFCPQKCAHCGTFTQSAGIDIESYVKRLKDMLAFYERTFAGRTFQSLYVGGGTPSMLEPDALEDILRDIFRRYRFREWGQKSFKFNPNAVTREKLAILKENGINRVTLEVQTLDGGPRKLENSGRLEDVEVAEAFSMIRDIEKLSLNVDVLLGMQGDSKDGFLKSLDRLMELRPDDIIVYPIQPTLKYLDAFYAGDVEGFAGRLAELYPDLPEDVKQLAQSRGYRPKRDLNLEDAEWMLRCRDSDVHITTAYSDQPEGNASLFGIGTSARSRIAGQIAYEEKRSKKTAFDPGERYLIGGTLPPLCEETRYILINMWKLRHVSKQEFKKHFGKDIRELYPRAVETLRKRGALKEDGDRLRFTNSEPRELFQDALAFMDVARAHAALHELDIEVESKLGRVKLRVEGIRPEGVYAATYGSVGVSFNGNPQAAFPGEAYAPFVELVIRRFNEAAEDAPDEIETARRLRVALMKVAFKLGLKIS